MQPAPFPKFRLLTDEEYGRMEALPSEQFAALSPEDRASFRHTAMRHLARSANQGVSVGGKTVEEAAEAHRQGRQGQEEPVGYIDGQPVHKLPADTFDGRI